MLKQTNKIILRTLHFKKMNNSFLRNFQVLFIFLSIKLAFVYNLGHWIIKRNYSIPNNYSFIRSFEIKNKLECLTSCGLNCESISIKNQVCKLYNGNMLNYHNSEPNSDVYYKIP